MLLYVSAFVSVAFAVTAVMPIVGVDGLLVAQPCFVQGNPWRTLDTTKRHARPVAMMGENAGHNPFNTIPGMLQYGNCMDVHFAYENESINITVVCGRKNLITSPSNGYDPARDRPQCPSYTSDIKWPLENLVYIEYDVRRFEVSSCVTLNDTHSYHGHLLLTDAVETRSYMLPNHLPMWRKKLQLPGMVPFEFKGNCSECNFRNEYFVLLPHSQLNLVKSPSEPPAHCREGNVSDSKTPNSHITMQVNVAMSELMLKLFVPAVAIFGCVLLLRSCFCGKKSKIATVVPAMPPNVKQ